MADKFKEDQARISKENEEQVARTEAMRPTPTQAENDRAKLGVVTLSELDNKEADGSAEEGGAEKDAAARPPKR